MYYGKNWAGILFVASVVWGCDSPSSSPVSTPAQTQESPKVQGKYYGLTAEEILAIPNEQVVEFCKDNGVSLVQFEGALSRARTEMIQEEISNDSLKLIRGYERIDSMLGIPKEE